MDLVFIDNLRLDALIGVHAHERGSRQPLRVDLQMACDTRVAAASDRLADTLDYEAVARRLRALAAASDTQLVEVLAERMAECVQREFGVRWLRLKLGKPQALAEAEAVGVQIERGLRLP
jgi:dihydroneopterin aldolase